MKLTEFFQRVNADDWIHGASVEISPKHKDLDYIKLNVDHKRDLKQWERVEVMVSLIIDREITWGRLREIILGRGNPHPITHVTRIVGYFSTVERWNKSKIGELMDRRAGEYNIGTREEIEKGFDARIALKPDVKDLDLDTGMRKGVK